MRLIILFLAIRACMQIDDFAATKLRVEYIDNAN